MIPSIEWQKAFARQAAADMALMLFILDADVGAIRECHRLMLLQMTCEKLCKAHLISQGASPAVIQKSHAYIAKTLPVVLRIKFLALGGKKRGIRKLASRFQQLANEIEVLSPAIDRDGRRPDNCEYPWQSGDAVRFPAAYRFVATDLVKAPAGRSMFKLIQTAIQELG